MKSLPAGFILAAICTAGAYAQGYYNPFAFFEVARMAQAVPVRPEHPAIRFSLLPLTGTISAHAQNQFPDIPGPKAMEGAGLEDPPRSEFSMSYSGPPLKVDTEEFMDHWRLFEALRRWRSSPQIMGLSHSFRNPASILAFDYVDIFETGHDPYKGGHGLSLFFRHSF